jgi:prolyl-tRNA synthetase
MRYSTLFGKTIKSSPKQSTFQSHSLLVRGGFIRESTAGRYFFLPLGWRVHEKIKQIIKEEMDKAGAQEMLSPVLHPLELWEETNRTNTTGFELMQVVDRRGARFALGGTAEEMFVDVVRKFQLSYKDLPFTIYQFSTKFRDELRARGGLLRVREFIMKDAYSFDRGEEAFKQQYELMASTYETIFSRMGLKTVQVAADNGYIGGEYCHEFQVVHPEGEGRFYVSEDGEYTAHEDVACFALYDQNSFEEMKPYEEVAMERGTTMADGQKAHGLPLWQQLKNVLYKDKSGTFYLAVIRGDLDVNEAKLLHVSEASFLEPATDEEIRNLGSEPGFLSPVGMGDKVKVVADNSVATVKNMYSGANKLHVDGVNINLERDFKPDMMGDIAMAKAGFEASDNHGTLKEHRGIEVGNIFQLGYHYTKLMSKALFTDDDGSEQPFYMGCYGIGLGRTMATIAEIYHDERGLMWPETVAPFAVHLVDLSGQNEDVSNQVKDVYNRLHQAGIEVLWDDREKVRAGEKFADADLIGCPVRLVVSEKTEGKVEWKRRDSSELELIAVEEVIDRLIKKQS